MQSVAMQVVEKHGGSGHLLRPDRVYRTGVISPWFNFAPGQDVQAISAEFTKRSMNLSGLALSGVFGAAANVGLIERLRLRFEAWRANMAAKLSAKKADKAVKVVAEKAQAAAHAQASAQGQAHGQPFASHGSAFMPNPSGRGMAYAQVGMQVAPFMMGQVQLLAKLTSGSMPHAVADAQVATTLERWHNMRWNG